jgi:molybdopterin synthase catalytic subunit
VDFYQITKQPIDVAEALGKLNDPSTGAQVLFLGTVRNEFEGRASRGLYYDVYPSMAEDQLKLIGQTLKKEFGVVHVVIVHRIGELSVGEVSVLVAVSSGHRGEAFAAAHAGIDRVKETVPIWKKERWENGSSAWHDESPDIT